MIHVNSRQLFETTFLKPLQCLGITQVPPEYHNMGNEEKKYVYVKDFLNQNIWFRSNFIAMGTGASKCFRRYESSVSYEHFLIIRNMCNV